MLGEAYVCNDRRQRPHVKKASGAFDRGKDIFSHLKSIANQYPVPKKNSKKLLITLTPPGLEPGTFSELPSTVVSVNET